ncbi:retrovirus-related pol polyprotein from transposon TNT 1-94 [Tanacetum coccineum]
MPIKISPWMKEMSWNFAYMTKVAKGDKEPVKDRDKRKRLEKAIAEGLLWLEEKFNNLLYRGTLRLSVSSACLPFVEIPIWSETMGSDVSYLLVYVDDIILTASSTSRLQQIISSLHSEFDMTDLKELTYFPGISEVLHSTRLFLSQRQYASQLLEHAHMANCNPSWTPVDTECKLGPKGVRLVPGSLLVSQSVSHIYTTCPRYTFLKYHRLANCKFNYNEMLDIKGKRSIRSNVLVKEVDLWIGKWMAENIHKMLRDGIDTWAPRQQLEFKSTIVNSPSWDESNLMPMDGNGMSLPPDTDEHFRTVEEDAEVLIYVKHKGNMKPLIHGKSRTRKSHTRKSRDGCFGYPLEDLGALWHGFINEKADWIVCVTPTQQQDYIENCFNAAEHAGWTTDSFWPLATYVGFKTCSTSLEDLLSFLYKAQYQCEAGEAAKVLGYTDEAVLDCAVTYTFLKYHRLADCKFNYNEMLDIKGDTFVHLLTTQAQIRNITNHSPEDIDELKKSSKLGLEEDKVIWSEGVERELGFHLLMFTEAKTRLLLCEASAVVMEKGFHLLGITQKPSLKAVSAAFALNYVAPSEVGNPLKNLNIRTRFEVFTTYLHITRDHHFKDGELFGNIQVSDYYGLVPDGWGKLLNPGPGRICLGVDLEPDEWIKDSGCSKHMTGNRKLFSTYKAYNGGNVIFGSNLRGNIIGKGTISNDSLKIDNVEHVDNLGFNLLSIGQICDNKCRVTFSEHDSEITKDGKVIGRGIRKKGLYVMKLGNKPKDKICLATIDENSTLWHRRLGHANMRLIQSLASKELVRNLPKLKFDQHFCDACKIGKQAHVSHKAKNIVSTTRCLELLHMDLFGPSAVRSYGGNRYTLVIVDDYSRYTWTRFLKDKTEAFDQFEIFSKKIQNQLGCTIVSIRTDHGREFDNEVQFGEFCNANGITHNFSAPRTPQSNGVVERKNRTLQEMSRTMLNEQSLPQKFWCNAVDTSTYILNRILIRAILGKTPYEILRGRKPTLDYFRVFGSKCFILNTKDYLTKFDPKSYEGVFLGYSQNSKAYIILNKHTRKIEESLNVTFDETPPPSKTSPLVDDDLDEKEAIREIKKKNLENVVEDETLEIDEIVNIKESRNHPLENVIGNLNQRTLRSQA